MVYRFYIYYKSILNKRCLVCSLSSFLIYIFFQFKEIKLKYLIITIIIIYLLTHKIIKMNHTTFTNVALFIKRAEEYQNKEFIVEAFASNNIGKVSDVKFIKKHNDIGRNYHGVIVIFERWNMNKSVQTLFSEMSASPDGTTRFYFDHYRYWIINIHRQKLPECEQLATVDSSLSDKDKISKLEELVKSMSAQIFYLQTRQEKSENSMMGLEHKETHHHFVNMELRYQLEEKDTERKWAEDEFNEEIEKLREENETLRCRLALTAIDMVRKDIQIEKLQQEQTDNSCVLSYVENQTQEMRQMLRGVLDTDPIKPVINTYIKEYLY